jgi:single-stranded DNA-binding protein
MEIIGYIKTIFPETQVSASFRKRELVVSTNEQYPQHILIEFNQDKCDILNSYGIGEEVKVSINIRGREWINPQGEVKYFNQIQGWRMERVTDNQSNNGNTGNANNNNNRANTSNTGNTGNTQTHNAVPLSTEEEGDDLPF